MTGARQVHDFYRHFTSPTRDGEHSVGTRRRWAVSRRDSVQDGDVAPREGERFPIFLWWRHEFYMESCQREPITQTPPRPGRDLLR